MKQTESPPPSAQLMKFIVGHWISKPIYVAAELKVADMLADGPRSIESLARETQSHAPSLYRMMRALASVGIFSEASNKNFSLTPMAECLKTGAMRSIALLFNSDWSDRAWSCFLDSIKTGGTAFNKAHDMALSDWLDQNPAAAAVFNEANALKASASHRAIIDAYDFSGINTITDVGGGLGVLMASILEANPWMKGVVFDTSSVIQEARKVIEARGMEDRIQVVKGDFFKCVPPGSDAYLLSNILHDWPDEKCRTILVNCWNAMRPESKLLVMEMVIPPGNEPSVAKLLDLEMMVITGGRERTREEFERLFRSSGFDLVNMIPTKGDVYVIEGVKKAR